MIFSIGVFNSRAPVWLAGDFAQKITGQRFIDFMPIGGMCCFDGMVVADDQSLPDDYRPLLALEHANSNIHPLTGTVSCGPEVGFIYAE